MISSPLYILEGEFCFRGEYFSISFWIPNLFGPLNDTTNDEKNERFYVISRLNIEKVF